MSLKPLAIPLMDAGKALARGGELIIESTDKEFQIYGGGLSATGANVRNAGDCIAQAAASCRFKTGIELVIDELREAATCLEEAKGKLQRAVEEANVNINVDDNKKQNKDGAIVLPPEFAGLLERAMEPISKSQTSLEAAGASIMKREALVTIGEHVVEASLALDDFSSVLGDFAQLRNSMEAITEPEECMKVASQRIQYASIKMKEAGENLTNATAEKKKIKGKGWIKGGM